MLGHQVGLMSDDWTVSCRAGAWDIQFDWEGVALQTEDWNGALGGG